MEGFRLLLVEVNLHNYPCRQAWRSPESPLVDSSINKVRGHRRGTEVLQGVTCWKQLPRTGVMSTKDAWPIQACLAIEFLVQLTGRLVK